MKIQQFILTLLFVFSIQNMFGQSFENLTQKTGVSFRGLETYGENVIWASGSKGTVGRSLDQGKTWEWVNPPGYEAFDFRDIEVFGKNEAVIISAGSPAVILRTSDGGKRWTEVYRNDSPEIFFNGIDFQGKTGFAIGDPIGGNFQLLKSTNKGKNWLDVSNHMYLIADEGEAGFAASGTGLQLLGQNLWVATGGRYSSLFQRNEKKLQMNKFDVPLLSGQASTGIFSLAFYDDLTGVVVGGDYLKDQEAVNNILLTKDGGETWSAPEEPVHGFRSCVLYLDQKTLIATGTSGTDISYDQGNKWKNISKASFNVIAKSSSGKHVYLASSHGSISKLIL